MCDARGENADGCEFFGLDQFFMRTPELFICLSDAVEHAVEPLAQGRKLIMAFYLHAYIEKIPSCLLHGRCELCDGAYESPAQKDDARETHQQEYDGRSDDVLDGFDDLAFGLLHRNAELESAPAFFANGERYPEVKRTVLESGDPLNRHPVGGKRLYGERISIDLAVFCDVVVGYDLPVHVENCDIKEIDVFAVEYLHYIVVQKSAFLHEA